MCTALGVTHDAVRQYLTALIRAGFVERGSARPSGGRPQACYVLPAAGRDLFARNDGLIATRMLERLYSSMGNARAGDAAERGQERGGDAANRINAAGADDTAVALAEQLDALGYEALAVRRDGETQVEAYNGVFHALARMHPDVCRFDLAFMQAATGRQVQHMVCLLRGGHACRFRLGARHASKS